MSGATDHLATLEVIKDKTEKAIKLEESDYRKARCVWNDLCSTYSKYTSVHEIRAEHYIQRVQKAGNNLTDAQKLQLLNDARKSAASLITRNPNSTDYRYLFVNVLYETAKHSGEGYNDVVDECERAIDQGDFIGTKDVGKLFSIQADANYLNQTFKYWCNLGYEGRSKILDVSVKDLKDFFGSVQYSKETKSIISILMSAVKRYKEHKNWYTWNCCLCPGVDNVHKDWSSIRLHVFQHFDEAVPNNQESLEIHDLPKYENLDFNVHNEMFILDKERLLGNLSKIPYENAVFLINWLRKDSDKTRVLYHLYGWEHRDVEPKKAAPMFIQVVNQLQEERNRLLKPGGPNLKLVKMFDEKQDTIENVIEDAICYCTHDYRKILLPFIKAVIQERLYAKSIDDKWGNSTKKGDDKNKSKKSKKKRRKTDSQVGTSCAANTERSQALPIRSEIEGCSEEDIKGLVMFKESIAVEIPNSKEGKKSCCSQALLPEAQIKEHSEVNMERPTVFKESNAEELTESQAEESSAVNVSPEDISFGSHDLPLEAQIEGLSGEGIEVPTTFKEGIYEKPTESKEGKGLVVNVSQEDISVGCQAFHPEVQLEGCPEENIEEPVASREGTPEEMTESKEEESPVNVSPADIITMDGEDGELMNKIEEYWRGLSSDEKCQMFRINVNEVQNHLLIKNNIDSVVPYVLTKAVTLFERKACWHYWSCCLCDNDTDYEDFSSIEQHIQRQHFKEICLQLDRSSMPDLIESHDNLIYDFFFEDIIIDKEEDIRTSDDDHEINDCFLIEWFKSYPDIASALEIFEIKRESNIEEGHNILEDIEKLKKGKRVMESDQGDTIDQDFIKLKAYAIRLSTYDLRPIVLPILILYIKDCLKQILNSRDETPDEEVMLPKMAFLPIEQQTQDTQTDTHMTENSKEMEDRIFSRIADRVLALLAEKDRNFAGVVERVIALLAEIKTGQSEDEFKRKWNSQDENQSDGQIPLIEKDIEDRVFGRIETVIKALIPNKEWEQSKDDFKIRPRTASQIRQ